MPVTFQRSMLSASHLFKAGVIACLVSLSGMTTAAQANEETQTKPKAKPISVAILGDSLADGLSSGLKQVYRKNTNVKVKRYSKVNTGIARYDRYDWSNAATKISKKDNSDIYLLMFGANDMQTIREKRKRYHFQTDGWQERYKQRIDTILSNLKKKDRKVVWVGLPIAGKPAFAKGYKYLNTIFKERASAHGVTYVDTWTHFASAKGTFQMTGKAHDGKKRLLRAKDKVHFTPRGYSELGYHVAKSIKLTPEL